MFAMEEMVSRPVRSHAAAPRRLLPLSVAALGVVFGDLGVSPLYALQDAFSLSGL
jgi:K+ transporter